MPRGRVDIDETEHEEYDPSGKNISSVFTVKADRPIRPARLEKINNDVKGKEDDAKRKEQARQTEVDDQGCCWCCKNMKNLLCACVPAGEEIKNGMDEAATAVADAQTERDNQEEQDMMSYSSRKTLAKGLMDIALLTANAAQLKDVLLMGNTHKFFHAVLVLVSLSIVLQACIAVILILLSNQDLAKNHDKYRSGVLNNMSIGFALAITAVNVFVAAFDIRELSDDC